ncbi:MAG: hypothetical protein ACM3UT_09345, partial [Chloroflexota bacterium]
MFRRIVLRVGLHFIIPLLFTATSWGQCDNPPTPPVIGTITQPTCATPTGSVVLSGLPPAGSWTLTRLPDNVTGTGSGTTITVTALPAGVKYNFTVTYLGCVSVQSADVVINAVPDPPSAPVIGNITQPTCQTATGTVALSGLPTGDWTLTISPGGATRNGSGTTTTVSGLAPGTYTFTVTAAGCTSAASENAVVNDPTGGPAAPVIGNITQPTCQTSTGSIALSGLPSGSWTINISPGNATQNGSGTTANVTNLSPGTYTFTVTAQGCTSPASANAVINDPPGSPSAPVIGNITQPTCSTSTGNIELTGLPTPGTWTVTVSPGGSSSTGTGASTTLTGLSPGKYTFRVSTGTGCTSSPSSEATINAQPTTPSEPVTGTPTQPTCETPTGSVGISGLPSSGTWTLTRFPGSVERTGTGTSVTISGLTPGTYHFTVTNAGGCTSGNSAEVTFNNPPDVPGAPVIGTITQPSCDVRTGIVNLTGLPSGGSWTLTRSPGNVTTEGTGTSVTVSELAPATYTFRVTSSSGCTSAASASAVVNAAPAIPAAPAQRIDCFMGNGFAIITVTSPVVSGYEYRLDNGEFQSSRTFSTVGNGNHTITVRSGAGCITTGDPFAVSCGCVNRPAVTLTSRTGTSCGLTPVTVTGNTFAGSASAVTITEDGAGTVTPASVTSSPFSFTYTPAAADAGKVVTVTFTTNNPLGEPCSPAIATYTLNVSTLPTAPVPGTVTQPTCTSSTGSIAVSGLPSTGTWTLLRTPGNASTQGSGATTTISGIESGTYTLSVTYNGCTSSPSAAVVVNPQPAIPTPPAAGEIVHPTCAVSTGTINLTGMPASGTWTLTRYPGIVTTTGTGATASIPALPAGTYNFTVTSASGCTSASSA